MIREDILYEFYDENTQTEGIAIGLRIFRKRKGPDLVGFADSSRPRDIPGKLIRETSDGFEWQRMDLDGVKIGKMIFRQMTPERFNEGFRISANKPPIFDTADELSAWYYEYFKSGQKDIDDNGGY